MRKTLLTVIISTVLFGCAGWSRQDAALQVAYTALHVADWAQTREVAGTPHRYYETNPILGDHPSKRDVDLYMGVTLLGHYLITDLLPAKWRVPLFNTDLRPRQLWQGFTIGIEATCVINNFSIGLRGEF